MPALMQTLIITFLFCENTGQAFTRPDFDLIRQESNPMAFICDVNAGTKKLDCTISLLDESRWGDNGEKGKEVTESYFVISDPAVPGRLTLRAENQDEEIEIVKSKAVLMQRITRENFAFAKVCSGKVSTLDNMSYLGKTQCQLFFDPEIVSKNRLNALKPLFPGTPTLSVNLSACNNNHQESFFGETERYRNCGSRDIRAPDFLHNAKVNVAIGKSYVAMLKSLEVPKELEWARTERIFPAFVTGAVIEQIIKYLESNDIAYLKETILEIDPLLECASIIEKIKNAKSRVEKARLAERDWNNCIVNQIGTTIHAQENSEIAWKNFLKTYSINEVCEPLD